MSPDYAFGQDVTRAFVTHLKKIRPDIEIVDQQWPKLGETDYTPFINAQMAKKPDAVFSSLWGGHFVTFAKQAKPLRYFEAFSHNFLGAGEAGAIETAKAMGDDYPFGIWANSYDAFNWAEGPPAHKEYIARLQRLHQGGSTLVMADHRLYRDADPHRGDRQGRQRPTPTRCRPRRCGTSRSTRRSASRPSAPRIIRPTARSSGEK